MRNNYSTRRRNMHRNKVTVHTKKASSSSSFLHFVTQKGTRTVKKKRKRQKKETKERKKERKNFDTEGDDDDVHTRCTNPNSFRTSTPPPSPVRLPPSPSFANSASINSPVPHPIFAASAAPRVCNILFAHERP